MNNGNTDGVNPSPESAQGCDELKLIAFYLPQFHPIPENDAWWGKGFTEWTNVTSAQPLFDGHHQPQLPADLGFYDLRLRESRHAQIRMARQFGIDGFCYHYYWFSGKRLLETPLEDMLADSEADMPFCLCWANENWTRRWSGDEQEILIEQRYLAEDPQQFAHDVARYMRDRRYLKCDGLPILVIYRPQQIPDIDRVVTAWREQFRSEGIGEVHLCAALTHNNFDYEPFGFDSGVEFPPHNRALLGIDTVNREVDFHEPFKGMAVLYDELAKAYLNRERAGRRIFRGVTPAWDNTARAGNRALFLLNATPGNYACWLSQAIHRTIEENPGRSKFVFVNAWNEWAEGCHLEPDVKHGMAFLEATLQVRNKVGEVGKFEEVTLTGGARKKRASFPRELAWLLQKHLYLLMRNAHERMKKVLVRFPRVKRLLKSLFSWY